MRRISSVGAIALLCTVCLAGAPFTVTPDHADSVYQVDQPVTWHVQWSGDAPPASLEYSVKKGELKEIDRGTITLTAGAGDVQAKLAEPGTLLLEVKGKGSDDKPQRALGGAVAAPEKIALSADRPADFDAFWEAKIKDLASVPANPQLESKEAGKPNVQYWQITLDNIRGTHIRGQLARPAEGDKYPALLIVQWAGVYGLQKTWVTDRAADGWLALDIEAHDLPIDQPESFYKDQSAGALKDYWAIGNDDRETSYFLRMYLGCYQAAEYLTSRPDWDGRTFVVMGGSQGGQQTLVTAGLHPKVTAALASVPAGCDMLGPDAGRQPGWPQWYWKTPGKDAAKVHEASRYFDAANFASRIKCPILVCCGLIDEVCPAPGICAAFNQIPSHKELVILPFATHYVDNETGAAYNDRCWKAWLPALKRGEKPPS